MYSEGDKFVLHSSNGHDYDIQIHNVNEFRPPEMRYGIDVYVEGYHCNTMEFCGDDFLAKCEKV